LQFAPPEPGGNGNDVQGLQSVTARDFEQGPNLLAVQGPYLLSSGLRRLYRSGGVAWDQPVGGGLLEGLAELAVDVQDGAGREPTIQLISVETAHVHRGELLQLDLAQRWGQVNPHELLVAFPGSPAKTMRRSLATR
jgi:hypothetical protein